MQTTTRCKYPAQAGIPTAPRSRVLVRRVGAAGVPRGVTRLGLDALRVLLLAELALGVGADEVARVIGEPRLGGVLLAVARLLAGAGVSDPLAADAHPARCPIGAAGVGIGRLELRLLLATASLAAVGVGAGV